MSRKEIIFDKDVVLFTIGCFGTLITIVLGIITQDTSIQLVGIALLLFTAFFLLFVVFLDSTNKLFS